MLDGKDQLVASTVEFGGRSLPLGEVHSEPKKTSRDYVVVFRWCVIVYIVFCIVITLTLAMVYGPAEIFNWWLRAFPEHITWKHVAYAALLTVACVVLSVPCSSLMTGTLNGALFGRGPGFLIAFVSSVCAAMLSFCLIRCCFKDEIRQWVLEGDERIRRMLLIIEDDRHTFKFLVLFRFIWVPIGVKNYTPGALEVSSMLFFLSVCISCAWFAYVTTCLGHNLRRVALKYQQGVSDGHYLRWDDVMHMFIGIFVVMTLCCYSYREYNKKLAEEEQQALVDAHAHSIEADSGSRCSAMH